MRYLVIPVDDNPVALTVSLNNYAEEGWMFETVYYLPAGAYAILSYDDTVKAVTEGFTTMLKGMIGDQT